jgi:hypothetical protein
MHRTAIDIPDLSCATCLAQVRQTLAGSPGVGFVAADLRRRRLLIDARDPDALGEACRRLADAGFPASPVGAQAG